MPTSLAVRAIAPARLVLLVVAVTLPVAACTASVSVTGLSSFSPSEGHFSVLVPGGSMTEGTLQTSGAFAAAPAHTFATNAPDGSRLAVIYADAEGSYLRSTPIDAALDAAEQGNLATIQGTLVRHGPTTVGGLPGREERISTKGGMYEFRLVFVGDRLFSVSVTGDPALVDGAIESEFLNSFTVIP